MKHFLELQCVWRENGRTIHQKTDEKKKSKSFPQLTAVWEGLCVQQMCVCVCSVYLCVCVYLQQGYKHFTRLLSMPERTRYFSWPTWKAPGSLRRRNIHRRTQTTSDTGLNSNCQLLSEIIWHLTCLFCWLLNVSVNESCAGVTAASRALWMWICQVGASSEKKCGGRSWPEQFQPSC